MRLILDTVTFIWALSTPERLSRAAMSALRKPSAVREISVVSLTEIAVKQTRGKLTFAKADAMAGMTDLRLRVLPYAVEHAFRLFDLPTHHADPFDRQIIAQALVENVSVVTPDESFRLYEGVKVIW
ncbi:MAG TPA: type II toxin-antitoxin system VapC family toxin [Vicinamibacterales bacterium]|nr:type II toxin-antitoxin system VapC family toxin [Vicinamibacterales bacterium]